MPTFTQQNAFVGGLNEDDAPELMPDTDWRFASGIISGNPEESSYGTVENTRGNERIQFTLPAGTNKCIGAEEDTRNSIFYFVYNSNGDHSILRFMVDTLTIEKVVYPQNTPIPINTRWLNFQDDPRYRIFSIDVVPLNATDDLLIWSDGWLGGQISIPYDNTVANANQQLKQYNPTRSLNVTLATNFCAGVTPRYPDSFGVLDYAYQNQYTDLIKYPPYKGPEVQFGDDQTVNTNYFRGKPMPQFRYRYRYYDNRESAWSPISRIALPQLDETIRGLATFNYYRNNFVDITYETGHETVVEIDIAIRFGNDGTWFRFETVEKYDFSQNNFPLNVLVASNTTQTFRFFNNDRFYPVATADLYNQSNVPILSRFNEMTDKRLMLGNNIEGYNPVKMDVESTFFIAPADTGYGDLTSVPLYGAEGWYNLDSGYFRSVNPLVNLVFPRDFSDVIVGTIIKIEFEDTGGASSVTRNIVIPDSAVVNQAAWDNWVQTEFYSFIQNGFNAAAGATVSINPLTTVILGGVQFYNIRPTSTNFVYKQLFAFPPIEKETSFKLGAWHKFFVIYYDDGLRSGTANEAEELNVYVPFYSEAQSGLQGQPYDTSSTQSGYKSAIGINLRNLAPEWANNYKIAYAGSNISFFVQLPLIAAPATAGNGNVELNVDSLLNYFVTDNKPTPINYTYQEGDRVRIMTNTSGDILSEYLDLRIHSLSTGSPNKIIVDDFDFDSLEVGGGSYIEIYRTKPDTDQDQIVYEFGQEFDVLYDQASGNWYHESSPGQTNQDPNNPAATPAVVFMERGDVYVKRRGYKNATDPELDYLSAVEDFNYSDFYTSDYNDIGRVNITADESNQSLKQVRLESGIRVSNQFFQNTEVNGLSTFSGGSGFSTLLPTVNGPITGMFYIGYTLKVLQWTKITSIYIGRRQTFNADGSEQLLSTDAIFGTVLPSVDDTGTKWPGSVVRNDRHLYYLDTIKGEMMRDAPNGQFAISKYKMMTKFRNLSNLLEKYATNQPQDVEVVSIMDERSGYYTITILSLNSSITDLQSQTLCFHEEGNRWKTYQPFTPERYGQRGQTAIVMFREGELWLAYSENVPYMNFFGTQYRPAITIIHNQNPTKVKVADYIAIQGNSVWEASDGNGALNITVPANTQYPNGMASRIIESNFKPREGAWYADFMGDANSPGGQSVEYNIINGRALRGYVFVIKLENEGTQYARLISVLTHSTRSELSQMAGPPPNE